MSHINLKQITPDFSTMSSEPTGFPVKFVAEGVGGIPSEIFVFKNIGDGADTFMFTNVAALYELADVHTSTYTIINNEDSVVYVRKAEVELILPSIDRINEVFGFIKEDVQRLVKDFNASQIDAQEITTTITGE